jgi:PAS domain S-box-containing protein
MSTPIRLLIVEDSEDDAVLIVRELRHGGYDPTFKRVETPEAMSAALAQQSWDIIIADYSMPGFSGLAALGLLHESGLDLPFIIVSGTIGEETAVASMRAGAHDYVMKDNLARLVPAVRRELHEAKVRWARNRAEEALRESEERYRMLFESSPNLVALIGLDGKIIDCNNMAGNITGVSREEIIGKPFMELGVLINEGMPEYMALFSRALKGEDIEPSEVKVIGKSGEIHWLEVYPAFLKKGDEISAIQVIAHDVTERRRAEEALKLSQEYSRNIIDSSLDMIIAVDMDRHIVEFNKAAQETFGYRPEEVLGEHVDILYADPQEGLRVHQETLNKGQCIQEIPDRRKNGEVFPCFLSASVLRDARGEVVGVMGVSRDITERKRAEVERERLLTALQHRSNQLQTAAEVSKSASTLLDPEELMNQTVNLIQERFNFYYVGLFLVDEAGEYTVLRAGTGEAGRQMLEAGHRLAIGGQSMIGWSVANAQARIALDVGKEAIRFDNPLLPETHSEMALPLVSRGQCIGALTVQSTQEATFSEEDIAILQSMSDHLAIALENARLYEEERRRVIQLELISGITQKIASILGVDELLRQVVHLIGDTFSYYYTGILLVEAGSDELIMRAGNGPFDEALIGRLRLKIGREGITGWVAHSGEPLLVNDISREPRYYSVEESRDTKSELAVPIKLKGEIIGVLDLQSVELDAFNEDDIFILQTLADQIAVAVENAELYEAEQKRRNIAETLRQASTILNSTLELNEVLELILQQLRQVIPYDSASIQQLQGEHLQIVACQGFKEPDKVVDLVFPLDPKFPNYRVIATEAPLAIEDVLQNYPHFKDEADSYESGHIRSWLGVPLMVKDQIIGMIALDRTEMRPYTAEECELATAFANQAAIAIENARLYQNERERAAQLAVVNQVARRAASILDPDQLLQEVVTAVQKGFNYHSVNLFLLDETASDLEKLAVASRFEDVASLGYRQAVGVGMIGWTAETGQPLLANDVGQDPRYTSGCLEEPLTKAELCVPLKVAGRVIGVLDVQDTQLNAFDETDLLAMETLADQLAIAIENARLYQETVRQLEKTETLGSVVTALACSLDLDQVLQSIVDSATRLIPASTSGVIHLVDEAARKLVPLATSPKVNIQESLEMPIGEGIAGLVIQEKRLINVPSVQEDPRFLTMDTASPYESLLTAPLMIDTNCIGALSLNSEQADAFNADDERLLMTLAAQAAIAVKNARLHQEIQRRVEELIFLNQVGRTVTSSLDLEQVLTTIMEETALMLKTEAGSVLLLDEESGELVFEAAVGPQSEKLKGLKLPLGQGIAGWVAREGQPLLVPDVEEDPRFYPGVDGASGFATKSVLAVPLKVKGTVIGVIEAVNKTEGDLNQADVELLSAMAQSAAIAIENAQLFVETRRRFQEMAALYDVSLDITARLERPELLKSIVERAARLLRAEAGGIYLYDSEREELRMVIGYDYTEKYVGVTLKPGEGMAGKVFQTGEPLIVDDYRTWKGRAAVFEANQPFTAVLEVPLKWQEQIIGVLVMDADAQERTFNQNDVWLATLFANQAAIAIENARLYEELQNRMEELKRTQAQLIRSAKLAAIGELAAGVAHEINNPLTSIMGFTRLLLQKVDDDDPMKEDLQIVDREAARTKAIVRSLLDFARQREPRLEPANVNDIVRSTMALVRHQAKGARVTIKESYYETLPAVLLDTDQIKQVFLNIVTNAIQAMPEGGELKVLTAYRPRARSPDDSPGSPQRLAEGLVLSGVEGMDVTDCVAVEVHDTGTGISEEDLPRIFDPFFTTKEVGQGTGLGLSISYGIVESHGGWIEVETEVGRGSTFTVMLPLLHPPPPSDT